MAKQTWKIEVTMSVDDSWIADGFDLSDRIKNDDLDSHLRSMLPYAYHNEIDVKVKILAEPDAKKVRQLQGYKD